jgi:predicted enzyme related to lactoylglutathione lyase
VEVLASRTIIHPSDLASSLAFYGEGLGLAIAREFGEGEHRGVVFFAGGGLIEVVGRAERPERPPPLALWLQVRSMARAVDELAARGVGLARAPQLEPWGLVEAWVEDPDGLRIHLVEVPATHPLRRDLRTELG